MKFITRLTNNAQPALPLAVGHVIRCAEFAKGLRWAGQPSGVIQVAWCSQWHIDYHVAQRKATLALDPTRAQALFLVQGISLERHDGPDDVFPESDRFSRSVTCIRLADDLSFTDASEQIHFSLNEPMSMAQPDEGTIEIVGFVSLPIFCEAGAHYQDT